MYETDVSHLLLAFLTTYLVILGAAFLFGIAAYIVNGFAFMSLYRKVGVKPWIAWVPYYNTWVWLKLGGQPPWLALLPLAGLSIVTLVFLAIGMVRTQVAFRRDAVFVVLGIFLPFVWAFMLGARDSVYEPWRITAAGYPPPGVGYGSVVPDYATIPEALPVFPAPPAPPAPPAA